MGHFEKGAWIEKKYWYICEYCFKEEMSVDCPPGWDMIMQCYICPRCLSRAKDEHPKDWISVVIGGAYANGKPDPRIVKRW